MSSNIGNLVDRVYREYLEPNDDIQSFSVLRATLDADSTDTIVQYESEYLTSEEEDAMEAGAFIEIGQELMLVTDLNTSAEQITVKRAVRGTSLEAHAVDDLIKINPVFPRKNVFDAVCDQIKNLYPTLFATETKSVTAKTGYIPLSGTNDNYLIAPIKSISQYTDFSAGSDETGVVFQGVAVELVDLPNPFTYTDAAGTEQTITYTNNGPNKVNAVQVYNVNAGHTVFITFKKKFVEPTAETDTLTTIGLETEYEPIIMAGVAAQIIAGRDIPSATVENITQAMQVQNFPVNSATSIRNSLLSYQRILIEQARKDLRARFPEPVTINKISYS
jgi:hypothetical protein